MKCPYCGKITKDMPNHLSKSLACSKKHGMNLLSQLKDVVQAYDQQNKGDLIKETSND